MIEDTLNTLLQKSKCNKRKVAAVVVDAENHIVGSGYNHTTDGSNCEDNNGNTKNNVIHAEVAAIHAAAGKGIKLYVTHEPCPNCLSEINRAGLSYEVLSIFKKFDKDKIRPSLIPPEILEQLAEVLTYGAKKYQKDNWKKGDPDRYMDALYRHLLQYQKGEWADSESSLPHLAHVLANVAFILYLTKGKK